MINNYSSVRQYSTAAQIYRKSRLQQVDIILPLTMYKTYISLSFTYHFYTVHELAPSDIQVIAAMGDSITVNIQIDNILCNKLYFKYFTKLSKKLR